MKNIEPEVLKSGFGVNFLFWPGEFQENCRRLSQRIWWRFFSANFSALFFQDFRPPPKKSRPKFTPRIVGSPLQFHFLKPNFYSRRFSAYGGDHKVAGFSPPPSRKNKKAPWTLSLSHLLRSYTPHTKFKTDPSELQNTAPFSFLQLVLEGGFGVYLRRVWGSEGSCFPMCWGKLRSILDQADKVSTMQCMHLLRDILDWKDPSHEDPFYIPSRCECTKIARLSAIAIVIQAVTWQCHPLV